MSKPIRVLHVIGIMNRGGAETLIMNLYRCIDRTKVQFDFVEGSSAKAVFDQEIMELGGRIYRCPRFNGKNYLVYRKWWIDFFNEHASEYTAVHGHIGSTAAIYLSIARKYGLHTIAHSHNTYDSFNLRQFPYRVMSFPTRFIADSFFACSEDAGISRFGKKVNFKVINNGIDTTSFAFNESIRRSVRKELGIDENTCVLGHVGRFSKQKNHVFLIEIMKQMVEKNENCLLMLVGDGHLRKEIEEKADSYSLKDKVMFLGVRENISELLQSMDVFVFPSLYEGFGIAALEAQTSGLPVLCSDKVSSDCYVTDLVHPLPLDAGAEQWADTAIQLSKYIRTSYTQQVKDKGFDIKDVAAELQSFYLKAGNHHE
ncbi:MAG: glycosyltransferase family 1 protein [Solobacterium sp.]|nr:glycosyltransferase family 1 protein [Solobacterium sp.]